MLAASLYSLLSYQVKRLVPHQAKGFVGIASGFGSGDLLWAALRCKASGPLRLLVPFPLALWMLATDDHTAPLTRAESR